MLVGGRLVGDGNRLLERRCRLREVLALRQFIRDLIFARRLF